MTKWQTRRELVTKNLPMWEVFRVVDGVEEIEWSHYSFRDEAIAAMHRLNAKLNEKER